MTKRIRIGAVEYLNTRPLTFALPRLIPQADVVYDLPSRLADRLAAGGLDVATIPSIEYARGPGYTIACDAGIVCEGPVRSIKLYGRVPVEQVRTLALDEGSRTSAALAQIMLRELFSLRPEIRLFPIGAKLEQSAADATLLIGDRAMRPVNGQYAFVWDLGQEWTRWTGLPFVFSMWVAREGVDLGEVGPLLAQARDEGVARLDEIARIEGAAIGLPEAECLAYLRDNLTFHLGDRQLQGLRRYYELAEKHGFIY